MRFDSSDTVFNSFALSCTVVEAVCDDSLGLVGTDSNSSIVAPT